MQYNRQNIIFYPWLSMLSKDSRLSLTEIACRMKLGRTVTLTERIWMSKLIKHNKHALGIVERIMCPYKVEDM